MIIIDGLAYTDMPLTVGQLEKAKSDLIAAYGDVEISVHPDADWFSQIKIEDEKWQADNENYCNEKAEWCNRYGCD